TPCWVGRACPERTRSQTPRSPAPEHRSRSISGIQLCWAAMAARPFRFLRAIARQVADLPPRRVAVRAGIALVAVTSVWFFTARAPPNWPDLTRPSLAGFDLSTEAIGGRRPG